MMHLNLLDGAPGVCAKLGIYRSGHVVRPVVVGDCGHRIGTGKHGTVTAGWRYATDRRRGVLCFPCADDQQREDMRIDGSTLGYLSGDQKTVTTWTGGVLLTVTRHHRASNGGVAGHRSYVQARDLATGQTWYGVGPGRGMYMRMRRHKRAPFCPGS